ncbi:MAG TPA: zinc-binding alcohol dehydrogenase family protein [Gaiellaceae bacterium]|nr:zinc-binding alcohol dehydrogenase family protein [Gaiellaceae bacterium]
MRAAQIVELSSPPRVVELDDVDGVRIEAVALNPLDISVGSGVFYGGHPPLPYVPGCEAAGRREDGTLVYLFGEARGIAKPGFMAERVVVPPELPLPLPAGVDPALAAAVGIAGLAGWVPAAWKAKVGPGDRVLVLGARGAVGRVAAQAAKLLGANLVVGAGRRAQDGIVALEDVGDAFGGDGFTVCIDPIWGEPLARVLAFAAPHARIVHVGQSAGPEAPLRSADVRGKELTIMGHSNFALSAEDRNRAYLELLDHLLAGRITLDLERHPLDGVAEAWERQRAGPGAKIVVEL